jgi:hypothetical protein
MSMCPKFSAQMNAKASSTILLLVLVGCHAISAHGTPYVLSFFQTEYPAALHNLLLLHVQSDEMQSTIADEGTDEVDGSGGGRRELDDGSSEVNVAGLCINTPCDADPNRMCFCCTRLANEPCYDTLKQCVSACPNCNFLVCPPPAAWRTRRLGSPPASPA